MEPTIELRVAELLASRLCHDLISPVGAVNSGIELLTEFGDDPDGENMALITSSARTASDKLLFFRIAYGNAGSGTNIPLADGLNLIAPVCVNQRTETVIDDSSAGAMPGAGAVKLLLCVALMAGECLPRGGTLTVRVGPDMALDITAAGDGARIGEGEQAALDGTFDVDDLDPKTAHAYFTHCVRQRVAVDVVVSTAADRVNFTAQLPVAL
ncbi:MAG: histidine phosphotransferase family protein [Alphaproteobacteria bacterium]